jgi:hypothetical protein
MPVQISRDAFGEPCPCERCAILNAALSATRDARRALAAAQEQAERAAAAAQAAGAQVDRHHAVAANHRYRRRP